MKQSEARSDPPRTDDACEKQQGVLPDSCKNTHQILPEKTTSFTMNDGIGQQLAPGVPAASTFDGTMAGEKI
jgi:hypothetical protein